MMDAFEKYYNLVLRFLSYRSRSEKEIKDYLKRKKADSSIVSKIIKKLKDLSFINDEEFTKLWIQSRTRSNPKGIRVIKMELKQKGISEALIESVIHNSKFITQNELDLAKKVLERKRKALSTLPKEKFREKASQLLLRRGFDFETIRKVIDEMWEKEYNKRQGEGDTEE